MQKFKFSKDALAELKSIIRFYNAELSGAEGKTRNTKRARGGVLRAIKGTLVEAIAKRLVVIA